MNKTPTCMYNSSINLIFKIMADVESLFSLCAIFQCLVLYIHTFYEPLDMVFLLVATNLITVTKLDIYKHLEND